VTRDRQRLMSLTRAKPPIGLLEQVSQTPRHRLMSLTRAKPVEGSWSKQVTHTRATASGDHACWQGRPRQRATLGVLVQNSTQAYAVVPRCGVG
jgi:hypothetical protein